MALVRLIRQLGVDIVHARSRAPAWSACAAARATGRRFVTTFHNAYGARTALKRRYNSVMARGDRVIAISDFVAEHAASVYGVGRDRLRTIPRGVDLEIFDPKPGRCAAHHQPCRPMAPARRHARRDASRPADAMEGRARFHRSGREARPKRHLLCSRGLRAAPRFSPRDSRPQSARTGSPASSASSRNAGTCRPPTCWPMSSSRPRAIPRGSAASSSRRRRWADLLSPPITGVPARRSCPASPAGSCRRATPPRSLRRSVKLSRLGQTSGSSLPSARSRMSRPDSPGGHVRPHDPKSMKSCCFVIGKKLRIGSGRRIANGLESTRPRHTGGGRCPSLLWGPGPSPGRLELLSVSDECKQSPR